MFCNKCGKPMGDDWRFCRRINIICRAIPINPLGNFKRGSYEQ